MNLQLDPEEPREGAPAWSVTFSDMALNMLCIFALLLSFSHYKTSEFRQVAGSVRAAFGVTTAPKARVQAPTSAAIVSTDPPTASRLVDATSAAEVELFIQARGLSAVIEVEPSTRGVVIRVRDRALFESGSAAVREDGTGVLLAVADLYQQFPGTLAVEGHTDDRPIGTPLFPSNWELSAARAASVLRFLLTAGVDGTGVHVAGYADMRPVASNAEEAGRTRNRRVEFVFEPR